MNNIFPANVSARPGSLIDEDVGMEAASIALIHEHIRDSLKELIGREAVMEDLPIETGAAVNRLVRAYDRLLSLCEVADNVGPTAMQANSFRYGELCSACSEAETMLVLELAQLRARWLNRFVRERLQHPATRNQKEEGSA